ncbi:hypothetical protein [Streptomyces sp. NPDC046887]|uniref:hypothetical protein n=1 Tax=Streptomyces sp. NPDC046887 TaxID=3155472 RepID=UPI003401BBEE
MLRTVVDGQWVSLPGTLREIRAALSTEDQAVFQAELDEAPLAELPRVAARWALPAAVRESDEELFQRLEAGDYSGVVDDDGRPVGPMEP